MHSSPSLAVSRLYGLAALIAAWFASRANGDDQSTPEPAQPVLLHVLPFVVAAGATETITLHGLNLQSEPEVIVSGLEAPVETIIGEHGSAEIPNRFDAQRVGDQFVEVALVIPANVTGELIVSVRTPAGTTESKPVMVLAPDHLVNEEEPNGGLTDSQPIASGQTVRGTIHQGLDVDTYRVSAHAGIPLSISVVAAAKNSLCDPIVMIFDQQGQLLEVCDDVDGSIDPSMTILSDSTGELLITVMDAHDLGSPLHQYTLTINATE